MLEPGQIFAARYRVSRRIAEGGMGAIFEAQHMATERRVALKLLFPHIMSVASARKKFELEAKISARVNSRNIVEVLDAGFDETTQSPFLVMELLEGQTLAQHVRDHGPLGFAEALPLLSQIAAGLDAAHGYREANGSPKPIVHRDLKPENLLLARDHGSYVVKILDYGIAKVLGETGNVSQEVRGTPLYMAFEQVTAGALSPQTDVWALGLIAYYMLTGSHYWRSASAPSANVQSLFAEILTLPLEAPSMRLRQQHSHVELPPGFDAWLLACIQRDPARRFASAGAAIQAFSQGKAGPKPRPRESKPAPPPVFNATEAFETPPEGPAPERLVTTGSLPAVASERSSAPAPAHGHQRRSGLPALVAGGALLLAGSAWLALRSGEAGPISGSSSAASNVEPPVSDEANLTQRLPELPNPPGAPISMPSASTLSPPAEVDAIPPTAIAEPRAPNADPPVQPEPPASTAAPAATSAPEPPTPIPEPHIGVAPRDDVVAPAAPLEARITDERPHSPSGERPRPTEPTAIAAALPAPPASAKPAPSAPAARSTPTATAAPAAPTTTSVDRPNKKSPRTSDAYRMR